MESEQFSLCWNNFHHNLRTGFHSLLQEEDLVDVTLAADGRYLKAHKTVLSVCSPYFKELFRANPCEHPIVILQDVKYSALKNLLQFMYQGEVSVGQDEIPTFMKVAEMLKIKGLTENNANNSNIPSDTNGVEDDEDENRDSPYMYEKLESKHIVKRTRPAKRLLRPIQHLRPLESPKTVKSPSVRSPQPVSSPQPPSKKQCIDEVSERVPNHPVNPKPEPEDHDDEFNEDSSVDMSSMLDTTLGESHPSGSWTPDLKVPADTSSPGEYQFTRSRKGVPHLVHDMNLFRPSGKSAAQKASHRYWECVKNRKTGCKARLLLHKGVLNVKCSAHNHPSPIEYIQEKAIVGAIYTMSL